MFDFSRFEYLTFDCYGTLIDWESGILAALRPILAAHEIETTDDAILHLYGEFESREEKGAYKPYRTVLEQVVQAFGARMSFVPSDAESSALADSISCWQPFPDTVDALRRLAARYRLAVISNIDDDLFAHTALKLQVPFTAVITAQQAGSYKPSLHNFRVALQRLGVPQNRVLHVAQSLFHDVAPARQLGIATAWVNRRKGKTGFGATPPAQVRPDIEVTNLVSLANLATPDVARR